MFRALTDFKMVRNFPVTRQFGESKRTTVDESEVAHFQNFVQEWWDLSGPFKSLHTYNKVRIPFFVKALESRGVVTLNASRPLGNLNVLDVGCGGGILSESLAALGGEITGLDVAKDLIENARKHAVQNKLTNLSYVCSSIEDFAKLNKEKYDVVVASEVIEHVTNKDEFLQACVDCLRPDGSIFITTISKNVIAYVYFVVVGEYLFGIPPVGTHQYEKLISPQDVRANLQKYGCKTDSIQGFFYNILTNGWQPCSSAVTIYGLHASKSMK